MARSDDLARARSQERAYILRELKSLQRAIAAAQTPAELSRLDSSVADVQAGERRMLVLRAADNPNDFMEFAFKDRDGGALKQAPLHRQWQDFIQHKRYSPDGYNRSLLIAPRDHGKCCTRNTIITLSDGSISRAEDVPSEFDILSWSESDGWCSRRARKSDGGEQPVWRIEVESGRSERLSWQHPMLTPNGMVAISDVRCGETVATCRSAYADIRLMPSAMSANRAWILGLLIGGGALTSASRVSVTIANHELLSVATSAFNAEGWRIHNRSKSNPGIDWSIIGGRELLDWLRSMDVHGHGAYEKRVPREVFCCDRETASAFVSGYLESDRSVGDGAAGRSVEFYSVAKELLLGLQSLLLRWGMQSRLAEKHGRYKGCDHLSWRLSVCGSSIDALAAFADPRGPKVMALRSQRVRKANDSFDLIPDAIVDLCVERRGTKEVVPRLDSHRDRGHQRWKVIARSKNAEVERLANLSWERVVDVREDGFERTWSIEVDDTHVHLAGDFITHNTQQLPVGRTIWELGNDPDLRIKIACQSDEKSKERLFEVTDHLERNQDVIEVFPHLAKSKTGGWTRHKITVERTSFSKDSSIEAMGVTSGATGGRADLLVADDICDRRNTLQFPQMREQVIQAWRSDWSNLLEPDGRIIYVSTLWHKLDCSHGLIDNEAYAVLRHDVNSEGNGFDVQFIPPGPDRGGRMWKEGLWMEKWPPEALAKRRIEIGQTEYDRAFRNRALSGEIAVMREEWIDYYDPKKLPENMIKIVAYDLAISKKVHGHYFAEVTIGVDPDTMCIYVLDAWRAKLRFMEQARTVVRAWSQSNPEAVVLESVNYQDSLNQYIDDMRGLQIPATPDFPVVTPVPVNINLSTVNPRLDKLSRLKRITPHFEAGKMYFNPRLDPRREGFINDRGNLVGELLDFPLGKTDDMLDALVHGVGYVEHTITMQGSVGPDELQMNVSVIGDW